MRSLVIFVASFDTPFGLFRLLVCLSCKLGMRPTEGRVAPRKPLCYDKRARRERSALGAWSRSALTRPRPLPICAPLQRLAALSGGLTIGSLRAKWPLHSCWFTAAGILPVLAAKKRRPSAISAKTIGAVYTTLLLPCSTPCRATEECSVLPCLCRRPSALLAIAHNPS